MPRAAALIEGTGTTARPLSLFRVVGRIACRQSDMAFMSVVTDRIRQKPTMEATEYTNNGGKEDR